MSGRLNNKGGSERPSVTVPFVDLHREQDTLTREIRSAMEGVLSSCNFILGTEVEEFERAFAAFVGAQYAVGVSNGLDALRLVLMALDIGVGDEVILPANTFVATALAVSAVGATPVLADCDSRTYIIDPEFVKSRIGPKTRAIIPVHLAGQTGDLAPILDLADRYGLMVIEDAAQAHGAVYEGRRCGSIGIAGCFSFYPSKNLGAYGDGGIVTTNNQRVAERIAHLRNYGQQAKYRHVEKGMNARLDTLQAAILSVKLRHLDEWNLARAAHAEMYRGALNEVGDIGFQARLPCCTHVYHLFIIETDHRDALQKHLSEAGIQTAIHYPVPIHLQPAYAELGYRRGDLPQAERLADRILSLPMFPTLTAGELTYVTTKIQNFFSNFGSRVSKSDS